MEKIIFQNEECYAAFKVFDNKDLLNYQGNFIYEKNNWYESLDVDLSEREDSYGLYLFKDAGKIKEFYENCRRQCLILKCFVPIKSNKIKFLEKENEFRCQRFFLSDEVVYNNIIYNVEDALLFGKEDWFLNPHQCWEDLTEARKDCICENNKNFNYEKYWNELTRTQKNWVCINNLNFDYEKYWNELTEDQKDCICQYNPNFDYEKYWDGLSESQKNIICAYKKDFNYEKYKNELTEEQLYIVCAYNKNFDYVKYWDELSENQKYFIKCRVVVKRISVSLK